MSENYIHEYWYNQAKKEVHKPEASWGDVQMMQLEAQEIKNYIKKDLKVLDAGCANGFSTEIIFSDDVSNTLVAFDFVELMVENAKKRFEQKGYKNLKYKIYNADIRNIPEEDNSFDISYSIRVLINLSKWEGQKKALNELIRVTKPGGTIIISEAFWGSLQNLNAIRIIAGLNPLYEHDFNCYLKECLLETYLEESGLSYAVRKFSSLYYLGTRLIRELNPALPQGFDKDINKDFFSLSLKYDAGDFGIQKQYIINKG